MPQELGHGVHVTEEADGVHYHLPLPRDRRVLGVVLLVPVLGFLAFLGWMTVQRLADVGNGNDPDWVDGVFLVLAWGGFAYGVYRLRRWLLIGWLMTFGHGSIRLRGSTLTYGIATGRIRSDDSRPLSEIKRIVVRPWLLRPDRPQGDLAAELTDGKVFELSLYLPLDTARLVAAHLAERCHLPTGDELASVQVSEELVFDPVPVCEPPPDTGVVVEQFDDGVTITVPPAGVWKASPKMFVGGLIYSALLVAMSAALVVLEPGPPPNPEDVYWAAGFAVIHWSIALSLILAALNRGRRRGVFAVADGRFSYLVRGLFGGSEQSWPVAEVADIRVARQIGDLSNRPVLALHITLTNRKLHEVFAHRDPRELAWIAVTLRRALGMSLCDPPAA